MPKTSPQTKSGTPRLSEQAKHLVVPSDIVSTGWPTVRKTCTEKLGITFDPWQDGAGRVILAKREDGNLAAMIDGVGMSLPRQVGKTYLVGALVFALCILMPGLLVIWTAHHLKTSGETFLALQGFAARARVAPFVKYVHTGSGDEEIAFHNGSRILFGARERGFGRGIPGVDVLIFDEAQILSDRALSNMLATLNVSRFGLQLYIGTPPKPEDMSESFKRMRRSALAGELLDGAWIEFGADEGADGEERTQWRKANPSYPKRTPAQSMLRLKRKLAAADWLREGMGVWDEETSTSSLISAALWELRRVEVAPADGRPAYGVKFSPDGARVSLAAAVRQDDDDAPVHVEVVKSALTSVGTKWLVDWLRMRWRSASVIVIDGKSGAGTLVDKLRAAGVPARVIVVPTLEQVITAHGTFLDDTHTGGLTHYGQEGLTTIVEHATKRPIGLRNAGGWGWQGIGDDVDVTPLDAVTMAHHGARTSKRKPATRAGEGRRAVIM